MPRLQEQFDRFYAVLSAKGEFSIDCDKCPIKEKCFEYAETHCPETDENALCCEELLLSFILTGETPTPQGSFGVERRDHGRNAPNFRKVKPFRKIFCEFFVNKFLPDFPKMPDPFGRLIENSPHMRLKVNERPAGDRERPSFRSVRPYANFFLTLAAFYMRLIFPVIRPADRKFPYGRNMHVKQKRRKILDKNIKTLRCPGETRCICFYHLSNPTRAIYPRERVKQCPKNF